MIIKENKLVVRQAEKYLFNPVIENDTMASPLNLVQAGGAFIDGDYAILTVSDGTTELGYFNYYFGKDITPDVITIAGGVDANMLQYTLTICNANGGVIYQGNE